MAREKGKENKIAQKDGRKRYDTNKTANRQQISNESKTKSSRQVPKPVNIACPLKEGNEESSLGQVLKEKSKF